MPLPSGINLARVTRELDRQLSRAELQLRYWRTHHGNERI